MQLVKRPQLTALKSQEIPQKRPVQTTNEANNQNRSQLQKNKRFKRNKPVNTNNSRSSSNCSQSNSISKFYVKNITGLISGEMIENQNSVKNIFSKQTQSPSKSPRNSTRSVLNAYGLNKQSNVRTGLKERKLDKREDSSIDISNFLKRQFSPPVVLQKGQVQPRKSVKSGLNGMEDAYNFLSPGKRRVLGTDELTQNKNNPKSLLEQLNKQRSKNSEVNMELERCKNNEKRMGLVNEQLELKIKRLNERIGGLEQQVSRVNMNNAKLKEENHRMKVLVKQRDSLMSSLIDKEKAGSVIRKEGSQMRSPRETNSEPLVSKIIEFQYENQKLRDTVYKLKRQIQDQQYQSTTPSKFINTPSLIHSPSQQHSFASSQITWDDKIFTDCLQQKDKEILELRQQIKNLQIEINYINRKWINEVERVRKIQKLQWMRLKDKYKDLLLKYKDNMKTTILLGPERDYQIGKTKKDKKRVQSALLRDQENSLRGDQANPQLSPKRRKRNYTVDHLKGRGVMSDIKINYGVSKTGHPSQDTTELELLQYSSCEEELAL